MAGPADQRVPAGIDIAMRALANRRSTEGLGHLRTVWTETRCPDLAERVELVGLGLEAAVEPLPKGRLKAVWAERFAMRRPADVSLLVGQFHGGTSKECRERLDRLLDLPADPRTPQPLIDWAMRCNELGPAWQKVWTGWLELLEHTGDPRTHRSMEQVLGRFAQTVEHSRYYRPAAERMIVRIQRTLKRIPKTWTPTPADVLQTLDAALDRWMDGEVQPEELEPARAHDVETLWSAVLANPDDDGARLVWADALLEAGDDRGAWVALQIAAESRSLTPKERRVLRRTPDPGPLAPLVDADTAVFRRGALYAARVRQNADHIDLLNHPDWGTVRQVQTVLPWLRRFPAARRTGLRLVPTPLGGPHDLPGWLYRPLPAPRFAQLRALAEGAPTQMEAICVSVPSEPPSAGDLPGYDGLARLRELHLVDRRGANARPRPLFTALGALATHPLLQRIDRLVLDDFAFLVSPSEIFRRFRTKGGELLLFTDSTRIRLVEREGLHAQVVGVRDTSTLRSLFPRPSELASLAIRTTRWSEAEKRELASFLSACPVVNDAL